MGYPKIHKKKKKKNPKNELSFQIKTTPQNTNLFKFHKKDKAPNGFMVSREQNLINDAKNKKGNRREAQKYMGKRKLGRGEEH